MQMFWTSLRQEVHEVKLISSFSFCGGGPRSLLSRKHFPLSCGQLKRHLLYLCVPLCSLRWLQSGVELTPTNIFFFSLLLQGKTYGEMFLPDGQFAGNKFSIDWACLVLHSLTERLLDFSMRSALLPAVVISKSQFSTKYLKQSKKGVWHHGLLPNNPNCSFPVHSWFYPKGVHYLFICWLLSGAVSKNPGIHWNHTFPHKMLRLDGTAF